MKIALLLSGLHYNKELNIDFRYYVKNIKHYLYNLGEIDVYFITKSSTISEEINLYYNNSCIHFMEDTLNRRISKTIKGIEIIHESDINYDYICITRPDIYFTKPLKLNLSSLNIFSQLETIKTIDDNFYFFPFSYLYSFTETYTTIKDSSNCCAAHYLKFNIPIHFICNENKSVQYLSSFKLRFFKKMFSLDDLYTDNITYYYNNYSICVNNNKIILFKKASSIRVCFMLTLGVGTYKVNHVYNTNFPISKYLLINNEKYGNNNIFNLNKPSIIYFVFDMNEAIHIVFHSIQLNKQNNTLFRLK